MNAAAQAVRIALVGNPNCGKTALFNRLTGNRQKVANYAGVTVERKEGRFTAPSGRVLQVIDLPGAYSLDAASPDEAITRDICTGRFPGEAAPDLIVCVADATNLRLHLRFVLEVRRLGRPMVLALNMMDAAKRRGIRIDVDKLEAALAIPVVETIAVKRGGAQALVERIDAGAALSPQPSELVKKSKHHAVPSPAKRGKVPKADGGALAHGLPREKRPLQPSGQLPPLRRGSDSKRHEYFHSLSALDQGIAPAGAPTQAADEDLHAQVRALLADAVTMPRDTSAIDDALDRVVLHPFAGLAILGVVMFLIFQAVFSWAAPLQDAVAGAVGDVGAWVGGFLVSMPLLHSLVTDGVFAGLGTVVEFLPQILILFLFILTLEESGYLPRAAFLLDKLMFKAGLTGRSFIPLLSSFACAIPGIMATRSIADPRDRLTTILVAPLMTCSARLPVYTLLIAAFIPREQVLGVFNMQGIVLFTLYFAGIASAMAVAWVIKRMRKDKSEHSLIMELPSYRMPHPVDIVIGLWDRASIFLRRVGGIILTLTVLLWFLSSFPAPPEGATLPAIDYSLAGRIGHWMTYVFAPIGFNWQICIALIPGLAAREVAVSSLATVYAMSGSDEAVATALGATIAAQWSLATALSLLAWYVFAPQCMSTLAVIKRETNSWRNVWISAGYLFGLAYLASFITYQTAKALT